MLGVFLLVALVLPRFVEMDSLRPRIAAAASEATGLTIALDGPIALRLLPRPAVRVSKVTVNAGGPFAAEVAHLDVILDLGALLSGRLAPSRVRLLGLAVSIPDLAAFRDWLARRQRTAGGEAGGESEDEGVFRLEIARGSLTVAGRPLDRSHHMVVSALSLLRRPALAGAVWDVDGEGAIDGVPTRLRAKLAAPVARGRRAVEADLTIAAARIRWRGSLVLPTDEDAPLAANGRLEVDNAVPASLLAAWRAWTGEPPLRRSNMPPIFAAAIRLTAALAVDARGIALEDVTGAWDGRHFSATARWRADPARLTLKARLDRLKSADLLPATTQEETQDRGEILGRAWAAIDQGRRLLAGLPRALPGGADIRLDLAAFTHERAVLRDLAVTLAWAPQRLPQLSGTAKTPDGGQMTVTVGLSGPAEDGSPTLRLEAEMELFRADRSLPALGFVLPQPLRDGRHLRLAAAARWDGREARINPVRVEWDDNRLDAQLALTRGVGGAFSAVLGADLPAVSLPGHADREQAGNAIPAPARLFAPLDRLLADWPETLTLAYTLRLPALDAGNVRLTDLTVSGRIAAEGVALTRLAGRLPGADFELSGRYRRQQGQPPLSLSGQLAVRVPERLAAVTGETDLAPLLARLPARWQATAMLRERDARLTVTAADQRTQLAGKARLRWSEEEAAGIDLDADIATDQVSRLLAPLLAAADDQTIAVAKTLGDRAQLHLTVSGAVTQPALQLRGNLLGARTQVTLQPAADSESGGGGRTAWAISWRLSHPDIGPAWVRLVAGQARAAGRIEAPLPFASEGRMVMGGANLTATGTLQLGTSDLTMEVKTSRASATDTLPRLTVTAHGERVDLDALGLGGRASPSGGQTPAAGAPWSTEAVGTLWPADWPELTCELTLGQLVWRGEVWRDLVLAAKASADQVALTRLSAKALAGRLAGSAALSGRREHRMTAQLTLTDIALDRAFALFGLPRRVRGKLGGEVGFTAQGASSFALVSSLKGEGRFRLTAPRVSGFDLDAFARDIQQRRNATQSLFGQLMSGLLVRALEGGETRFADTQISVSVRDGIATIGPMTLESTQAHMAMTLVADLPGWRLQGDGEVHLKEMADAPPLELRLSGPLHAPRLSWRSRSFFDWLKPRLVPSRPVVALPRAAPELTPPPVLLPEATDVSEPSPSPTATPEERAPASKLERVLDLFGTILEQAGGQDRKKDGHTDKKQEEEPPS